MATVDQRDDTLPPALAIAAVVAGILLIGILVYSWSGFSQSPNGVGTSSSSSAFEGTMPSSASQDMYASSVSQSLGNTSSVYYNGSEQAGIESALLHAR